jgi:hypothetical protein
MSNTLENIFDDLEIRPMTKRMAISLLLDQPLTIPALNDFGVDTADHYRALKEVLFIAASDEESDDNDKAHKALCARVKELDEALGNGPKLNALVRKYAPHYAKVVHFHTSWDDFFGRKDEKAPTKR